jgi:SAM-dependent methyltransferase
VTPLGWAIDYFFLNAIGWKGIRVRRENLERMLRGLIEQMQREGKAVRILDIAAGPGRYVLETIQQMNGKGGDVSAVLRDYMDANLQAARAMADQLGVKNITVEKADAFDRGSLAALRPRPTIAIASGLYELFPENECVGRSLAGIGEALADGGHLIYTCQPWHPQVEMIARTLTNREGKPWIMRRRSQAEMDALVRAAGFEKVDQVIDKWGIFTVSLARKISGAGR